MASKSDPCVNPYQYLNLEASKSLRKALKYKNLFPINSYFYLYSMRKYSASLSLLTSKPSRDDIVLASDSRFVCLSSDFYP